MCASSCFPEGCGENAFGGSGASPVAQVGVGAVLARCSSGSSELPFLHSGAALHRRTRLGVSPGETQTFKEETEDLVLVWVITEILNQLYSSNHRSSKGVGNKLLKQRQGNGHNSSQKNALRIVCGTFISITCSILFGENRGKGILVSTF